ncbi:hypothetical protein [Sulfuricella sp.]|uniref:hypothetical protein n=1 Tax=Sulfuricella sp. TaxID=2099377 RepID=UPI002B73DBB3|nr:hypothetical protein [Sulfuricella sp.]HUX64323.1 hypothetical protein [Sulfuricella sp.]
MEELERKKIYYRLLFIILRGDGHMAAFAKANHITCKPSESAVDAAVRLGLAVDPWEAVELIAATILPDPRPFAREIADLAPSF